MKQRMWPKTSDICLLSWSLFTPFFRFLCKSMSPRTPYRGKSNTHPWKDPKFSSHWSLCFFSKQKLSCRKGKLYPKLGSFQTSNLAYYQCNWSSCKVKFRDHHPFLILRAHQPSNGTLRYFEANDSYIF